jgi:POT family proton-dependent oligopeptide transporter
MADIDARDRAFFGHPAGLSTLFFTEMWERFSYYGMRAFLIFYMTFPAETGARGMSVPAGGIVLGLYTSAVYLLSLPGGWIADRFLGQRRAVTFGGLAIMFGNVLLALPNDSLFYPGLAIVALGTGLLKPNISTIVGQLYKPEDPRRESGFTIYYMGINIGAFAAPFACGYLAQDASFRGFLTDHGIDPNLCWKFSFGVVAFGMAAGLVQYIFGQRRLGNAGATPTIPSDPKRAQRDVNVLYGLIGGVVAIVALALAFRDHLDEELIGNIFGVVVFIIAIGLFAGLFATARDAGERKRIIAMIPLFIGAIAFFGIFEQASSTLNLFAEDHVNRELVGANIPASYYQSVNSVFILLLAPVFAWLWLALVKAKKEPSTVAKFAIGMLLIALAFVVMLPTLGPTSNGEKVSGMYLIVLYLLYTCSELCISPVGLASMSRLAPQRMAGMVMGTWFLATAIGNYLAGRAAEVTATKGLSFLFYTVIALSAIVATALFVVAPMIRRMLEGEAAKEKPQPLPEAKVVDS